MGAHPQPAMRSHLVVIVERGGHLLEPTRSVRPPVQEDIIPFETLDEALSHAVGLGALHGREAGRTAQRMCVSDCLMSRVGTAVIGLPFDGLGHPGDGTEAASTASPIRSRTCSPATPDVVAVQVITS